MLANDPSGFSESSDSLLICQHIEGLNGCQKFTITNKVQLSVVQHNVLQHTRAMLWLRMILRALHHSQHDQPRDDFCHDKLH